MTDVTVENVDYSDPEFPPDYNVAERNREPRADHTTEMTVSPMNDNNDGGVDA